MPPIHHALLLRHPNNEVPIDFFAGRRRTALRLVVFLFLLFIIYTLNTSKREAGIIQLPDIHSSLGIPFLFCSLKGKCYCCTVAHFRRSPILDWTRIDEGCLLRPLVTMHHKLLKRSSVQIHKSLANHRFHLAVSALHIKERCERNTTSFPLIMWSICITHGCHISCLSVCNKMRST